MKKTNSIKEHFLTDHYSIIVERKKDNEWNSLTIMTVTFWHKRRYHMYSDVIFGWVLWIWLSSWHFVSDILIFFGNRLKICRVAPTPASTAATAARRASRQIFKRLPKKNQNIRNKVPTTQPNPQYSAKNNVTIHVIVPFMPNNQSSCYCIEKILQHCASTY